jgi:hypothetical protein
MLAARDIQADELLACNRRAHHGSGVGVSFEGLHAKFPHQAIFEALAWQAANTGTPQGAVISWEGLGRLTHRAEPQTTKSWSAA